MWTGELEISRERSQIEVRADDGLLRGLASGRGEGSVKILKILKILVALDGSREAETALPKYSDSQLR